MISVRSFPKRSVHTSLTAIIEVQLPPCSAKKNFFLYSFLYHEWEFHPTNRFLSADQILTAELIEKLGASFKVETLGAVEEYQPAKTHEIGLYTSGEWFRLTPKEGTYEKGNAVEEN